MAEPAAEGHDEITNVGLDRLADELYDLQCELDDPDRMHTVTQAAAMRARIAHLEPLVRERLNTLLAAED